MVLNWGIRESVIFCILDEYIKDVPTSTNENQYYAKLYDTTATRISLSTVLSPFRHSVSCSKTVSLVKTREKLRVKKLAFLD